jgi:hypothetical protein
MEGAGIFGYQPVRVVGLSLACDARSRTLRGTAKLPHDTVFSGMDVPEWTLDYGYI